MNQRNSEGGARLVDASVACCSASRSSASFY
jgi:hypothetical protein